MLKLLKWIYWLAGTGCLAYWLVLGLGTRFGQAQSWIWIFAAVCFFAAGLCCLFPLPGWLRVAWRAALCAVLALMIGLCAFVMTGMHARLPDGLDAILVLGAYVKPDGRPSGALEHRIDLAAEYLNANPDTVAIATGGKGADEPISEAACIRDALIARGVDPARILMEDQATDTVQNMVLSKALLPGPDAKCGLVTNNFHVARSLLLAKKAGYTDMKAGAATFTRMNLPHYVVREAIGLFVQKLGGEL